MSCRRICRELLWLARFGEFGPSSAPHLDHLASCRSCRDEVGFDRALVRQLRTALAARVEAADPSPRAWEGVLARMRQPEPRPSRLREWSLTLVARLRVGSTMAGASLAVVLALNFEIVSVMPSDARPGETVGAGAPARPLPLVDGFPHSGAAPPAATAAPAADDATVAAPAAPAGPQDEQLPAAGLRLKAAGPGDDESSESPAVLEPVVESTGEPPALAVRLVPADAAGIATPALTPSEDEPDEEPAPEPVPPISRGPS